MKIRLPDGRIIMVPDGLSDDQLDEVVSDASAPPAQSAAPENSFLSRTAERTATAAKDMAGVIKDAPRQAGLAARYAVEGISALPAMAANVPAAAYNVGADAIQGEGKGFRFPEQQAAVSGALDKLGLPKPQGAFERVVGDASGAVSGVGATGAAGLTNKALSPLASNLMMQAKSAIGSAGAAGATRESGGGELAQLAARVVGGGLAAGAGMKKTPPTSREMKDLASAKYAQADELGGVLKPEITDSFIDKAKKIPSQGEMGRALAGKNDVSFVADTIEKWRGKPITLRDAQEIDEELTALIDNHIEMGLPTKVGKKLQDMQRAFRETVDTASESDMLTGNAGFSAWKEGKDIWRKAAKMRDIESIIGRAEVANDSATALKNGFAALWNDKNRLAGFTDYEKQLIKKAAESTMAGDVLRSLSGRLISQIAAGTGSVSGAAAAQAAATASKGARAKAGTSAALNIANTVAAGGRPQEKLSQAEKLARAIGISQGIFQSGGQ